MMDYIVHKYGDYVDQQLAITGKWLVANIDQTFGWPKEPIAITYEGNEFLLLTYDTEKKLMPAIALRSNLDSNEVKTQINRFMSAINWVTSGSISIDNWTGGSRAIRCGGHEPTVRYLAEKFRLPYLPENLDEQQKTALALIRDGDALKYAHKAYSFLSYYRVINLFRKNGEKQKRWIRRNLENLPQAEKRRITELNQELQNTDKDAAHYLFESCRCAVAHAGVDPTVDPDEAADETRLAKDLPVIYQLAVIAVSQHFEIPSQYQIYEEHLYETQGFKELLSTELIEQIINSDAVSRRKVRIDQPITIKQWPNKEYGVFNELTLNTLSIRNGEIKFVASSRDGSFSLDLYVDLKNSRFEIDIENPRICSNEEKFKLSHQRDYLRFFSDFIANGEVEIFSIDGKFIGRKDANLPMNIDLGATCEALAAQIEQIERQLEELGTRSVPYCGLEPAS